MEPKQAVPFDRFNFEAGRVLASKYEILRPLGSGWQGEVYLVRERGTGIERAAKLFYPQRNPKDRTLIQDARKLHRLRNCPILIQYHSQERIVFKRTPVTCLISDFVEGEPLFEFLKKQPGKRLTPFEGIHLLYSLAKGLEPVHVCGEYHGDLHDGNIMIRRFGIGFEVKVLDVFHWWGTRKENIQEDVFDLIRILYDSLGGQPRYSNHPAVIKRICCGLKKSLISKKYRNASQLRSFLDTMEWD
ncbi:MAG: protein kinase [Candidatus Omnitrophica bacterium]|nr:protein kinase [Candidatus Omnitrophota bacterium]